MGSKQKTNGDVQIKDGTCLIVNSKKGKYALCNDEGDLTLHHLD